MFSTLAIQESKLGTRIWPVRYFEAARERTGEAHLLHRQKRYALSIYISGVAVECMIRAFRTIDGAHFDERHNLILLLQGCNQSHFSSHYRSLHAAVSVIHKIWDNDYRFSSSDLVLTRLRKRRLLGGIRGNPLKHYSGESIDSAFIVLKIGEHIWPSVIH